MNVHTCIQCRYYYFVICVHVECALPHCVLYVLYLNGMLSYKITKYRTHHMSSDQIYIYMYLMIHSSQQMTEVIAFLSNLLSLVPCEDLLTLLLHLQTKKHLTDKFLITLQHNVTR